MSRHRINFLPFSAHLPARAWYTQCSSCTSSLQIHYAAVDTPNYCSRDGRRAFLPWQDVPQLNRLRISRGKCPIFQQYHGIYNPCLPASALLCSVLNSVISYSERARAKWFSWATRPPRKRERCGQVAGGPARSCRFRHTLPTRNALTCETPKLGMRASLACNGGRSCRDCITFLPHTCCDEGYFLFDFLLQTRIKFLIPPMGRRSHEDLISPTTHRLVSFLPPSVP